MRRSDPKLSRRHLMLGAGGLALAGPSLSGPAVANDGAALLADLHRRTFNFFWETTDAATGLSPDNWPNPNFCSIAAVGFALNAYCIGAEHGHVTRQAAAERTLVTLRTFWNGPQGPDATGVMGYKGFFYHFLRLSDGLRYDKCELSSIDTSLFILGALTSAAYFTADNAGENEIRRLAQALYERIDWTFLARKNGLVSMGWHPEPGLPDEGRIDRNWDRYNEGMMVYLLAMASPTRGLSEQSWTSWAATIDVTWGENGGNSAAEPHLGFSPLFGHQYSHIWYDFRGIADPYMRFRKSDYFTNSRRATYAQRNYAIKNPHGFTDYSGDIWGLTACIGPADIRARIGGKGRKVQFHEYGARGPQGYDQESFDDGTIAPTAALSSIPFAPEICLPVAQALFDRYGADLYGDYGFHDAFNPSFPATAVSRSGHMTPKAGWVSNEYLGIDQGPILSMLENYKTGLIWRLMHNSPVVRTGLLKAGFSAIESQGAWLAG